MITVLDTYIGIVAANIKTADGAEKTALEKQLADLKTQRDTAYTASHQDRLNAAQAEIDAVGEKINTAQGAELAVLKAHQALLVAQYGTLAGEINTELDKIESPKLIDIVANIRVGTSNITGQRASGGTQTSKVAVNPDGSITYSESFGGDEGGPAASSSQPLYADAGGNVFYDEAHNNPASGEAQKAFDETQGAQYGAFVRGSRMGSLVRVGENYTDENITPVKSMAGGGRRGGGQRGSGGRREYPIYIGEEKLTTLVLNAQNELVDTGRS